MASLTMAASFLGNATGVASGRLSTRRLVVAKATTVRSEGQETPKPVSIDVSDNNKGRRAVMFVAATAAISAMVAGQGSAFADEEEPKRGTGEAKKKYGPVCVTMPTARICHK